MPVPVVFVLLFIHWIGDFLFQTSAMATQKATSIKWLSIHVTVYTATLLFFSVWLLDTEIAIQFSLLNGALHWITDFFTSKLMARYLQRPRIYYPLMGFDQLIHQGCLLYSFHQLST
jgi:hypothetical protein